MKTFAAWLCALVATAVTVIVLHTIHPRAAAALSPTIGMAFGAIALLMRHQTIYLLSMTLWISVILFGACVSRLLGIP